MGEYQQARSTLENIFAHAVSQVQPRICLPSFLPAPPSGGKTIILSLGKGAMEMAALAAAAWPDDAPLSGVVVTKEGQGHPLPGFRVIEASHPVPSLSSQEAALALLDAAGKGTKEDLVLVLL